MRVERIEHVDELRPLARLWVEGSNAARFGLRMDVSILLTDLAVSLQEESALFAVKDGSEVVGMFAVFALPSYLGDQKVAVEKYWYSMPDYHVVGPMLFKEGLRWAQRHGCSHLLCSASVLATDKHEKLERFYVSQGMKKLETVYIKNLEEES
jgi:hypothetical protein